MALKLTNNGFSVVGVIVTLLVIGATITSGILVWRATKTAEPTRNTSQTTPEDLQPADPSEGGKYLVIKEWGVRFALPQDLQNDLEIHTSGTALTGTTLFKSKRLNEMGGTRCDLIKQPDGSYLGGLSANLVRVDTNAYPPSDMEPYKQNFNYIKTVGNYQYYYPKSNGLTCATTVGGEEPIPGFYATEQDISEQLTGAFKDLQATP